MKILFISFALPYLYSVNFGLHVDFTSGGRKQPESLRVLCLSLAAGLDGPAMVAAAADYINGDLPLTRDLW
jgi:hypothetical protein